MKDELLDKIRNEAFEEFAMQKKDTNMIHQHNTVQLNALTDDIILNNAIRHAYEKYKDGIKEKDTNNVYVYTGTYNSNKEKVEYYNFDAMFRTYDNVEGIIEHTVYVDDVPKFEKDHIVLFVENIDNVKFDFLKTSVLKGQHKSVKKMIKKYGRK